MVSLSAEELTISALALQKQFNMRPIMPALRGFAKGAYEDVLNTNGCCYYQWLPCLLEIAKPKQIVELGGAMGAAAVMMCNSAHQDFKLYSITLPEEGQEFSFVLDTYPQLVKVLGDDLDLSNWPKDCDLSQTDLWFFDSLHSEDQLRAELDLYSPFFKKESIVLFDDIHMHEGMFNVWKDIKKGKYGISDAYDGSDPLHHTGFGVCKV